MILKETNRFLTRIFILSFPRNIQLIERFKNYYSQYLKKDQKNNKFITYLNKNWFINYDLFNYSILLKYKINNDGENSYLKSFYVTNNIAESLHSKINKYLPKNYTSPENFVVAMKKIFINNNIKNNNIKRYDIKTRALIQIIKDLDLNNEYKWVEYKTFKNYEKQIIKNLNKNYNESEINNIHKEINYYLEESSFINEEEKRLNNNNDNDNLIKNIINNMDDHENKHNQNKESIKIDAKTLNNIENNDEMYNNEDNNENNKELVHEDEKINFNFEDDIQRKNKDTDNNMNNNENDENIEDISELKINEKDDIKSNINENDNLVSSNDINKSDLSNEEENNENEDGSDELEHNNITEYNNNLLELYEEITNNLDKLNIENRHYEPNKNLRESKKIKLLKKMKKISSKKQTLTILLSQKLEKEKLIIWKMKKMNLRNMKVQQKRRKLYTQKNNEFII